MAVALCFTFYNIWDGHRAADYAEHIGQEMSQYLSSAAASSSLIGETASIPDYVLDPEMEMPEVEIDGKLYIGELVIPALEQTLPVMSKWSYPDLRLSPCRYDGSAYLGNLIIAAHNYPKHFGRLEDLDIGDVVYLTDMADNLFCYKVSEVEELASTALEEMREGEWDLTLFTCTPGGKARVTVRCRAVEAAEA